MPRRKGRVVIREVPPDPIYNDPLVTKCINIIMRDGKKSLAEKIFYSALEIIKEKTGRDGYEVFKEAVEKIKPDVEVRARRVGGVTYQVPIEVNPRRKTSLALRWLVWAARERKGRDMRYKLAQELIDATQETGGAWKKKEEIRKIAEANKAFAHYAW